MIHYNKDKIITNLFYALICRPAWYIALSYGSRRWRRFSIAVDAHIRRRVRLHTIDDRGMSSPQCLGDRFGFQTLSEKKELLFLRVA